MFCTFVVGRKASKRCESVLLLLTTCSQSKMAKFTSETVISMFEAGNFPEDLDSGSESEDEVLDLADPDAGIPDSHSEGQQSDLLAAVI